MVNLKELRYIQKSIAKKVILKDEFKKIKLMAGFDLAFDKNMVCACVVVNEYLKIVEEKTIEARMKFPYIPTFLAFREGPLIIKCYKQLKKKPDLLLINGHGIAHPYFCGIASHVGVVLNKPTIGIARNKLVGKFTKPKRVGNASPLIYKNKKIGFALLTKKNCKPIFISPGHKISLKTSLKIVKDVMEKQKVKYDYKLPFLLQRAHELANKAKSI